MKTVLITGATGGLAQALADNLTKSNWQLVLVSRNSKNFKKYTETNILKLLQTALIFKELNKYLMKLPKET